MDALTQNTLYHDGMIQMFVNVIHWALGAVFVLGACWEISRLLKARRHRRAARSVLPEATLFNGIIFCAYVLMGIAFFTYLNGYHFMDNFTHEQQIHVKIGGAWLVGGLIAFLARDGKLKHPAWRAALPLSLIAGGYLFLHEQHGFGDGLKYLTIFHRWLAGALFAAGAAGLVLVVRPKLMLARFGVAVALVFTGGLLVAYRHPLTVTAACPTLGETHHVAVTKDSMTPAQLTVTLCDQIEFTSADGLPHQLAFGAHEHHSSYPGLDDRSFDEGRPLLMSVTAAGKFNAHDHYFHNSSTALTVLRPDNLNDWRVRNKVDQQ